VVAPLFLDALVAEGDTIAFDSAKLAAATSAFERAIQSGNATALTHELLMLAFFLETKKKSRACALQVVAVARGATPVLARSGVAFDDVATQAEQRSASLLGQTTSKMPVGQNPSAGARWWQVR
jgi:hypothetical protein